MSPYRRLFGGNTPKLPKPPLLCDYTTVKFPNNIPELALFCCYFFLGRYSRQTLRTASTSNRWTSGQARL